MPGSVLNQQDLRISYYVGVHQHKCKSETRCLSATPSDFVPVTLKDFHSHCPLNMNSFRSNNHNVSSAVPKRVYWTVSPCNERFVVIFINVGKARLSLHHIMTFFGGKEEAGGEQKGAE